MKKRKASVKTIPVIDLFAGAGGIGLGAHWAGGDLRLSVELDATCCETMRRNSLLHPGQILQRDVAAISGEELRYRAGLRKTDPLIIVGGPPCQPFSKAAYWLDPGDDSRYRRARARGRDAQRPPPITRARPDFRRTLVDEFLERVRESRATGFVFENVVSITHPRNRVLLERFIRRANDFGYKTTFVKANAAEYGAAQLRERIFVLGSRYESPSAPSRTHSLKPGGRLPAANSAREALRGLHAKRYFEPEERVEGRWAKALNEIPPGSNYKALTKWAGHPRPLFEAETRFWNFLLKLAPERPSWTIAANPGPWIGPFHWESRRLRTVEMAALQSFPRSYEFAGNRRERVRQIGNAAPPLLVREMVRAVIDVVADRVTSVRMRA